MGVNVGDEGYVLVGVYGGVVMGIGVDYLVEEEVEEYGELDDCG